MLEAIAPFVKGKVVYDLGAGTCEKAVQLQKLGAEVFAFDKAAMARVPQGIKFRQTYFEPLAEEMEANDTTVDVAFLSWPQNYTIPGLREILWRSRVVIYLGSNTSGSSCGFPMMWADLVDRKKLTWVEDRRNTLIVYGDQDQFLSEPLLLEEYAGMTQQFLSYEENVTWNRNLV